MSLKRRAVLSLNEGRLDVEALVSGRVGELPPMTSHVVRVFISSTFSDMYAERNALMEMAYPALKEYCRQNNLEFQAYDLRWGIRDNSIDDHSIVDFCLKEIKNCQEHSIGPNLAAFIGQKYGFRPLLATIISKEFYLLVDSLRDLSKTSDEVTPGDLDVLLTWYKEDSNVNPHVHRLQPISSLIKNFKSEISNEKDEANRTWQNISWRILRLLRKAANKCLRELKMNKMQRDKFFVSVTELELEMGMFENPSPSQSCLCFYRSIGDLRLDHPLSSRFVDLNPDGSLDAEAQEFLHDLKGFKIPNSLRSLENIKEFQVAWEEVSCDEKKKGNYLSLFSKAFVSKMKLLIERSLRVTKVATYDIHLLDIMQHVYTAQSKGRDCRGRSEVLNKIRAYLKGRPNGHPLIIHGESGCGKSAVMAKAFLECQKWFPPGNGVDPVIIVRFFGTTSLSCDIRLALSCICWQISMAYTEGTLAIPGEYSKLVVHFSEMLALASSKRPLILLMDSLDQLSSSHRAHSLAWLPHSTNVYILLTTLNDHAIFSSLSQRFPSKQNLIKIPPFERDFSFEIVKDWLRMNGRSLTSKQFEIVQKAFTNDPVPLYTVLVCQEVGRWSSYLDECNLAPTCHAIIISLFERTEKYYGFILVKHLLSYITASKNGLSVAELEDILSLDDVVLGDVFQHWVPPILRIPPLLLCRIRDELSNYLVEREENGTPVIYWYHNQFLKVAKERYLSDCIFSRYVHSLMGHYFLGTWSGGRKKPLDAVVLMNAFEEQKVPLDARNKVLQKDADRMVARQPLRFDIPASSSAPQHPGSYNLRKLIELPHHLIQAKMFFYLRNHVLFNYEWIHAKMAASSLHDLLADYQEAVEADASFGEDPELLLLRSTLRIGGVKLNDHPDSLGFELLGRLMNYYDDHKELPQANPEGQSSTSFSPSSPSFSSTGSDFPSTPDSHRKLGDSSTLDYGHVLNVQFNLLEATNDANKRRMKTFRQSNLLSLLQQCDNRSIRHSSLLPVHQCFEPPDMMLLQVLEGHTGQPSEVLFLSITSELVTVSKREILFWDLNSCGAITRRIIIPDFASLRSGSAGTKKTNTLGTNRIFANGNQSKLVVCNTAAETPALVYDLRTGNLERKCGSKQANSSRTFLAGDFVFCQQNVFFDIRTGRPLCEMSDFVKTKNFACCAMSKDSTILAIGEEGSLKVFDFLSQKLLHQAQLKVAPNIIAIGDDNVTIFVGHTRTCSFSVYSIVQHKWSAGLKLQTQFNFKKKLPPSEINKHENLHLNEITDIVLPPENPSDDNKDISNQVLLNISRVTLVLVSARDDNHLTLMNTDGVVAFQKPFQLEKLSYKSQMDFLIGRPSFSGSGEFVLAGIGNRLCVWSRTSGEMLRSVAFHTYSKFFLTTAERHLAITTSTLNGAVRVWDLRAAKMPSLATSRCFSNCGPVRILCCARDSMLTFVCNSHSSMNVLAIRQRDHFGIDALNLLDGSRHTLLNYGKFGILLKMKASSDGRYLALLLTTINQNAHYVAVINVADSGSLVALACHKFCRTFETSPNWSWLATEASFPSNSPSNSPSTSPSASSSVPEIIFWKLTESNARDEMTEEYARFENASCPKFLLDCQRVAFVSSEGEQTKVKVFMMPRFELCAQIGEGNILDVKVLPGMMRDHLLISNSTEAFQCINSVWSISTSSKVTADFVSDRRGIVDVSKDGRLALDSDLNVYDMTRNGILAGSFKGGKQDWKRTTRMSMNCDSMPGETAKLTYDGRFVLWLEQNELKAGRVEDGCVVGSAFLHEGLACLEVVESGYMQVIGGENGRVFVVRLMAANAQTKDSELTIYNPKNLKDRQNYLFDRQISLRNSQDAVSWQQIDAFYGGGNTGNVSIADISSQPIILSDDKALNRKMKGLSMSLADVSNFKISPDTIRTLRAKANIPLTELGGFVKNLQSTSPDVRVSNVNLCDAGHKSRSSRGLYKTISEQGKKAVNSSSVPPKKFSTLNYLVASTLNTHPPLPQFPKK